MTERPRVEIRVAWLDGIGCGGFGAIVVVVGPGTDRRPSFLMESSLVKPQTTLLLLLCCSMTSVQQVVDAPAARLRGAIVDWYRYCW